MYTHFSRNIQWKKGYVGVCIIRWIIIILQLFNQPFHCTNLYYQNLPHFPFNMSQHNGKITTIGPVWPAKTQIRLYIHPVWQSLRKQAYTNMYIISPPKTENFQIKKSDSFHISAQNIDCGYSLEPPRRGGSNEYPQSMFWAEIRKTIPLWTPVLLYKGEV